MQTFFCLIQVPEQRAFAMNHEGKDSWRLTKQAVRFRLGCFFFEQIRWHDAQHDSATVELSFSQGMAFEEMLWTGAESYTAYLAESIDNWGMLNSKLDPMWEMLRGIIPIDEKTKRSAAAAECRRLEHLATYGIVMDESLVDLAKDAGKKQFSQVRKAPDLGFGSLAATPNALLNGKSAEMLVPQNCPKLPPKVSTDPGNAARSVDEERKRRKEKAKNSKSVSEHNFEKSQKSLQDSRSRLEKEIPAPKLPQTAMEQEVNAVEQPKAGPSDSFFSVQCLPFYSLQSNLGTSAENVPQSADERDASTARHDQKYGIGNVAGHRTGAGVESVVRAAVSSAEEATVGYSNNAVSRGSKRPGPDEIEYGRKVKFAKSD